MGQRTKQNVDSTTQPTGLKWKAQCERKPRNRKGDIKEETMMKNFSSYAEYESWTATFENASDYEEIPVAIDDGWKISIDMFTACKSYKTALRRFEKTFRVVSSDITGWVECMRESCESGCFEDTTGWRPAWSNDPEEIKAYSKNGTYSLSLIHI